MTDLAARGGDMAKITQLVQTRLVPATDFQRTMRIAVGKAWSTDARPAKGALRAIPDAAGAHLHVVAVAITR
ncbi:MAG: ABC-type transport system involved in resistance to organic solvents, auxiliary component [uncultured Caballeronia sp.]|nr:MAG: ABC-type transport system involved in resistance to organic solvents, auxiliary component [uncultured Caballeronia sp.]